MGETNQTMVEARGLARTFRTRIGAVEAVAGVDFAIGAREIVGFLGPNGAGKTTTQRMLSTLLAPTAGEATVAGCDLRRDPLGVRRRIGYVAQGGSTNPSSLVDEELMLQAQLYGPPAAEAAPRAAEMRARLDLADLGGREVKTLSGGQKRRLDIALGLIHGPGLVFLDEPSTGLDPQSRANLWQHIRGLRDELGTTVFLTTHYLDEADALCDRILIIDHGKIVAEGTPDALKRRIVGDLVVFAVGAEAERAHGLLASQPGVREVARHDGTARVTVERGEEGAPPLMRALDAAKIPVASMAAVLLIVLLLGVALSSFSYAVALKLKSEDALAQLLNSLVVPILLLSGILLPMSLAPRWLYLLSRLNPFSHVVDGARAAVRGDFGSGSVAVGFIAALLLAVAGVAVGTRTFHREST